jgi:hypothetical protein
MTQPRRWFQIHLSTAVVMMLLASVFLFLNVRNRPPEMSPEEGETVRDFPGFIYVPDWGPDEQRGWPLVFLKQDGKWFLRPYWKIGALSLNVGFGVVVLTFVSSVIEFLIRRRTTQGMSEPPKRRFLQIHLSTAVVLTLLLAASIWINVTPRITQHSVRHTDRNYKLEWEHNYSASIGWPLYSWKTNFGTGMHLDTQDEGKFRDEVQRTALRSIFNDYGLGTVSHFNFGCNVVICGAMLLLTVVLTEYLIRRRKPQP